MATPCHTPMIVKEHRGHVIEQAEFRVFLKIEKDQMFKKNYFFHHLPFGHRLLKGTILHVPSHGYLLGMDILLSLCHIVLSHTTLFHGLNLTSTHRTTHPPPLFLN
jgi:hypothetical protein